MPTLLFGVRGEVGLSTDASLVEFTKRLTAKSAAAKQLRRFVTFKVRREWCRGYEACPNLLPLYDNSGKRFPARMYATERDALVERFGGVTAYMRSPAKGLWKDEGNTTRDDMVILEVMMRRVDQKTLLTH